MVKLFTQDERWFHNFQPLSQKHTYNATILHLWPARKVSWWRNILSVASKGLTNANKTIIPR